MRTFQVCVKGNKVQYANNLHFEAVYYKETDFTDVTIPAGNVQLAYNIAQVYFRVAEPYKHMAQRNRELRAMSKHNK